MKKIWLMLFILFPINVLAYSNKLIISGEPIGIEVHSKGVYIIDFYKVHDKLIAKEQGLKEGDIIEKINDKEVNSIEDLNNIINKVDKYKIIVDREGSKKEVNLKVEKEDNIIKTGLYVKDQINGIGTLSYIDPETKIFASLGHEIIENTSLNKFRLQSGTIYKADINSINKSKNNGIGEIHASITSKELGEIDKNEINGIYGRYTADTNTDELIEINNSDNIKTDKAYIRLSLENNNKEDYSINIISLNKNDKVKNILFEITDERLINKSGGIVQGMSGSPIIQDNKLIGVVNYVVVDDVKKGYGIFIETMLNEGDNLLNN